MFAIVSCVIIPIKALLISRFAGVGSSIQCTVTCKILSVLILACHASHIRTNFYLERLDLVKWWENNKRSERNFTFLVWHSNLVRWWSLKTDLASWSHKKRHQLIPWINWDVQELEWGCEEKLIMKWENETSDWIQIAYLICGHKPLDCHLPEELVRMRNNPLWDLLPLASTRN